jgi:hypothetical protein
VTNEDRSDDIVLHSGKKEVARVTIPGSHGRVVAVQVNFLPGDNGKLTDLTVQLAGARADDDVTVVESHGVIGFAPNPVFAGEDEDDLDELPDE